jgi:hypothetical protein
MRGLARVARSGSGSSDLGVTAKQAWLAVETEGDPYWPVTRRRRSGPIPSPGGDANSS